MSLARTLIDVAEVFVARSAAEPSLPKMQPPSEKEAARSRLHSTPQQSTDAARGFPIFANRLEQGKLLAVDPGGTDTDDGFLRLHVIGDCPDIATDDCRGGRSGENRNVCLFVIYILANSSFTKHIHTERKQQIKAKWTAV